MEVHVGWNVADLAAIDGDLVRQHARGRNLDRVGPVVVVVAEGIREVQDGVLGDLGGVRGHVEVSGLHGSLGHGVRHEEEVKGTVHHFRLLDEAVVHVCALRRVSDTGVGAHLEESLSDSLVHDDQGVLWKHGILRGVEAILLLYNLL